LEPLENMEFPAEYAAYEKEYKLTLKFAGQKAKKAFRKVNIETSRCLKQLLKKEIGEGCAVCDPTNSNYVTDETGDVLVVTANKAFCTSLESSCMELISAKAAVENSVYESLSDAVTFLTALGAGEQSEVDLKDIDADEAAAALADDEARQRGLITKNKSSSWSDLKYWEQETFMLTVMDQRTFGYKEAEKKYNDYVPDEDMYEEALDKIANPDRRLLYSDYGEAKDGTLGMKQGCVARLIEAVVQALKVDNKAAADLVKPIKYRIKERQSVCAGQEALDLADDKWFIFDDGTNTTDHTLESQAGKNLFNLTIPDDAVVDDNVASDVDVFTFIGNVENFVSLSQQANKKCYDQTFKEIVEEQESLLAKLRHQSANLAILKEFATKKAAKTLNKEQLIELFGELTFHNEMNEEYEGYQEERRERHEKRSDSEFEDNRDLEEAEKSSTFFSELLTKFYKLAQKGVNRLDAEEEILDGFKRYLESHLKRYARRMKKEKLNSLLVSAVKDHFRTQISTWKADLKMRKEATLTNQQRTAKLYEDWKAAETKRSKEVTEAAVKFLKQERGLTDDQAAVFTNDQNLKMRVSIPAAATLSLHEQLLRTQMLDWIYSIDNVKNVTFEEWSEYASIMDDMVTRSDVGCKDALQTPFREDGFSYDFTTNWKNGTLPQLLKTLKQRLETWREYQQQSHIFVNSLSDHRWRQETLLEREVAGDKAKTLPKLGAFLADASVGKLTTYWNSKKDADKTAFLDACKADAVTQHNAMTKGEATKAQLLYSFTRATDEELYARMFNGPKNASDIFNFPDYLDKRMSEDERSKVPGGSDKVDKLKIEAVDSAAITKKCETIAKLGIWVNEDPSVLYNAINPLSSTEMSWLEQKIGNKPLDVFGFADDLDHQFAVLMGYTKGLPTEAKKTDDKDKKGRSLADEPNKDLSKGPVYFDLYFSSQPTSEKQDLITGLNAALSNPGDLLKVYSKFYKIGEAEAYNMAQLTANPFSPTGLQDKDNTIEFSSKSIHELMMFRFRWITFINNSMRYKREVIGSGRIKRKQNVLVPVKDWKPLTEEQKVENFKKSSRYSAATGLELDPAIELPELDSTRFFYEAPCNPKIKGDCERFICGELAADLNVLFGMETGVYTPENNNRRRRLAESLSYKYVDNGGIDAGSQADNSGVTIDASVDGVDENSSENLDSKDVVEQSSVDSAVKKVDETNKAAGDDNKDDEKDGTDNDKKKESTDSATLFSSFLFAVFTLFGLLL